MKFVRYLTAYLPISVTRFLSKIGVNRYDFPEDIIHKKTDAGGVNSEWIEPTRASSDHVLMYLHGGGFVYPASPLHYDMVIYLARRMNVKVLAVDYRLSPEFPFPGPLVDCVTAYRWLINQGFSSDKIVIAGDSAGAHLTITTLMQVRDEGLPLPAAAACLSPVIDMTSRDWSDKFDLVLHPRATEKFHKAFIRDHHAEHPLISPINGNWEDLPPILVHAGGEEILREDAMKIDEISKTVNTKVDVEIYPRMWHVWQLYTALPQAQHSLDKISSFLSHHLLLDQVSVSHT